MEGSSRPRRSALAVLVSVVALSMVALTIGAVILWPQEPQSAVATPPPAPPTHRELAERTLAGQAKALMAGDEKGWLAPVDAKLKARYRTLYRNLRGLEVSHAEFHVTDWTKSDRSGTAYLAYCLGRVACPAWDPRLTEGAPKAGFRLTFETRGDSYVITGAGAPGTANYLQPAPWENRTLWFARGKRVIVAGPAGQKKHLRRVLAIAEKSAAVVDRYAGYAGVRPSRYRIYLADEKAWKNWYGGKTKKWVIGYELPLNATGGDVVLRSSRVIGSTRQLTLTIQHELTHVATLTGTSNPNAGADRWLVEGIAEYVGAQPRPPSRTGSRYALAESFRKRGVPKSIVVSLADDADDLAVNTVYAMGHYASACMAAKYGERRLLDFVERVLRDGEEPDVASRAAYGRPFKTVDRTCLSWIKERV